MLNQVTCVATTSGARPWERISRLGGRRDGDGGFWNCTQQTCIAYIEKGCRFYVEKDGTRQFLQISVTPSGRKYLRSNLRSGAQCSLLDLPEMAGARP